MSFKNGKIDTLKREKKQYELIQLFFPT